MINMTRLINMSATIQIIVVRLTHPNPPRVIIEVCFNSLAIINYQPRYNIILLLCRRHIIVKSGILLNNGNNGKEFNFYEILLYLINKKYSLNFK